MAGTTSAQGDYYDQAVAHFTAHPEEIEEAWKTEGGVTGTHRFGRLFSHLSTDRTDGYCGCPSMVKAGAVAASAPLTKAVRALPLLPARFDGSEEPGECDPLTVESLPAFAAAQRLADDMLGRTPPQVPA
jgi:hypothetical protein